MHSRRRAAKVEKFVENGGTFLTTFFSGIVNETDIVTLGGYPGELRNVLGIWAEEIDALHPDETNQIVMKEVRGKMSGNLVLKEKGVLILAKVQ